MLINMQEDLMLTVEDVAGQLKISVMTVRRLINSGELEASKIGGQLRIQESDLSAYIDRQRVKGKPKNANKPARLTAGEMNKVGVDLDRMSDGNLLLQCQTCGKVWQPNIQKGGHMPRGYWRCPNGCNAQAEESEVSND